MHVNDIGIFSEAAESRPSAGKAPVIGSTITIIRTPGKGTVIIKKADPEQQTGMAHSNMHITVHLEIFTLILFLCYSHCITEPEIKMHI